MSSPQVGQNSSDLIRRAMLAIGAIGSGETPSADEIQDGLATLGDMLDAWDADGLMIFTLDSADFPMIIGQQNYTLGPGGDFDVDRPVNIDRASVVINPNSTQPIEYPLDFYSAQSWQEKVPVKNVLGSIPLIAYDDCGFPSRTLSFWPIPQAQVSFRVYSWQRLSKFIDLASNVSFPPAYSEALRWNLAVRMAPEFGKEPSSTIIALALQSLAAVRSSNPDDTQLRSDLSGSYSGSRMRAELFNIP